MRSGRVSTTVDQIWPDLHQVLMSWVEFISEPVGWMLEACFVKAIEIKDDYGLAYNNLASLLQQPSALRKRCPC